MLDRLIPGYFLKIFSKLEKEPLDIEASRMLFEKVAKEINTSHKERFSIDGTIVTLLMLPHEENGDGSDNFEATLNRTLA